MLAIGTHNFDKQLTVVSGAHYPGPSSPIQALRVNPFRWKVFYRNSFREKMRKSKNQSTNQSTTQLSHANLHVLFCVLKNLWQQWRKACGEIYWSHETMYFRGKACSKNNSLLERADSRVQHIWRLRVMGSWLCEVCRTFVTLWTKRWLLL